MIINLIRKLKQLKINLELADGKLNIQAPKGVVTQEILDEIKSSKTELIEFLTIYKNNANQDSLIPQVEPQPSYPLSSAQKRLWVLGHYEGGMLAYNISGVYLFKGSLNMSALAAAFDSLIYRHESLRTVFRENESGEARQFILPAGDSKFNLEYEDVRGASKAEIKALINRDLSFEFDLSSGPLLRAGIYQEQDDSWVFCYVMHHIISDGWSIEILTKELLLLYNSFLRSEESTLPPLRIHYKDYADWQQKQLGSDYMQVHKNYWLNQFAGELPVLELSADKPRPPIKTYNGRQIKKTLDASVTGKIKSFSNDNGGTLFIGLVSVVNALFYKYTGQEDIVIGSPITGRNNIDLENQIGFYINTLPLRARFRGDESFLDLFSHVKEITLDAYEHQMYPFDELVDNLQLSRDISRNPLFDVQVILGDGSTGLTNMEWVLEGLKISGYNDTEGHSSKFDLIFNFIETGQVLDAYIEYNDDIYYESSIDQLADHLGQLLEVLLKNPQQPMCDLNFLTGSEKESLLNKNGAAGYMHEKTIVRLFEEQVLQTPDNVAVAIEGEQLTYVELNERSNQLAGCLRKDYAIGPDDLICIKLERGLELIISILAVLKSGGAYVPIDPAYPQERIDYLISDSKCKVVLDTDFWDKYKPVKDTFGKANPEPVNSPGNLAYVIYTSGTTGLPKGTLIEHRNVVSLLKPDHTSFDFCAEDVWTMFHSYSFDFSVWEMYGALLYGGKLVLVPSKVAKDPVLFRDLLAEEKVTVLNQTPSAFYNLMREESGRKDTALCIRYVIFGGEALAPGKLRPWRQKYPRTKLINMYGITETTVHVTYKEIGEVEIVKEISNIGVPLSTLYCYVLDKHKNLLPVGVPGELYVGGAGVARGYLNRDDLTEQRFIGNPFVTGERLYRSGDKVRLLANGEMEYLGRVDSQVKIRGYRIELGEVENALRMHELIEDAIVIAILNEENNAELAGYIVGKDSLNVLELRRFLGKLLPDYMIPSHFIQMEEFVLTSHGKVDRKHLPNPLSLNVVSGVFYTAAQNELQHSLVAIFEEVLKKNPIGIKEDFFVMGGDSIKAIKLAVTINKELGLNISIANLFEYKTIEALSEFLASNMAGDSVTDDLARGRKEIEKIRAAIEQEALSDKSFPASYEDIYPLTPTEEGMIYSSLLRPDEPVYYDQFPFFFHIERLDDLKGALKKMMDRHPILRTKYYIKRFSKAVKVVLNDIALPLNYVDLSGLSLEEQKVRISEFLETDQEKRLEFDNELLWQFQLFGLGRNEYALIWSCHHAVLDGWSVSTFVTELTLLLNKEQEPALPPLPYSYKDYCAILLGRKRLLKIDDYWKNLLKGYVRNKLPFNSKGVRISDAKGMKKATLAIGPQVLSGLHQLVAAKQISFKSICVSAHVYLLSLICAEKDVVTGVVTHDRPGIENSEHILGCFLNTIPIRVNFSDLTTVSSLLNYVNSFLINVKPNEIHMSEIATLVEERSGAVNPVFDTLLNFTDFHSYEAISKDTSIKNLEESFDASDMGSSNEMTNTLFDVEVDKTLDSFSVSIKYVPSHFNEKDINYSLELYARILECFSGNGELPLSAISLLTKEERNELVYGFNDTQKKYDKEKTLDILFEEQVQRTPDAIALTQDGVAMSYDELNRRSNQLAHYLVEQGLKSGDNMGLLVSRSFDMIIGMFGILKAGGAYVPIDPTYPLDRQMYIISNSAVSMVVTDVAEPAVVKELGIRNCYIDNERLKGYAADNLNTAIKSSQLAYTIYTSGSTGRPKGVMIEHHSVVNLVEWVNTTFNVGGNDRLLFITSMCFDLSVYDVFGMLSCGGSLVIVKQDDVREVKKLKHLLQHERITFWDSVPTTMNYLVSELEDEAVPYLQEHLRLVFLSGDWIPVQLPDRIKKYFPSANVISLGGATEGTVWSNYYPVERVDPQWSSIPYGKPITNNFFYILNDDLQPVLRGIAGELYIGGVGVARGYANDEEKTQGSFVKDPFNSALGGRMYKTGDLGRMSADGNMEFLGRKDNQVKIRGFRVELGEIEHVLLSLAGIEEAAVLAKESSTEGKFLVAYFVSKDTIALPEIRSSLSRFLPEYMVPSKIIQLEELPLNSNGKIDRHQLLALKDAEVLTEQRVYEEAGNEIEQQVLEIWKETLEREAIGINDNFFELGGHSLMGGRVINKLARIYKANLEFATIFLHPTVKELSVYISNILRKGDEGRMKEMEKAPLMLDYPLSSAQKRLWILSHYAGASTAYSIPGIYVFDGVFDLEAFTYAFNTLVERHEILRTVFIEVKGEPRQKINPREKSGVKIEFLDFSNIENVAEGIEKEVNATFYDNFDLINGPLLKLKIIKEEEQKHVLVYNIHHIIFDGISNDIFIEELQLLYNAAKSKSDYQPEPLVLQYKDYAYWQSDREKSGIMDEHKAYWLKQLAGPYVVPEFPLDFPRTGIQQFSGDVLVAEFSKELRERLNSVASANGSTLYTVLLAAFKILLFKYTGKNDIFIGTNIAGRINSHVEKLIGLFTNTNVLRTFPREEISFVRYLAEVGKTVVDATVHEEYQFNELISDLNVERSFARNPLFDIMFVYNTVSDSKKSLDGIEFSSDSLAYKVSKFDMTVMISPGSEGVNVAIEYKKDILYREETISIILKRYWLILEQIANNPSVLLKDIGIVLEMEKEMTTLNKIDFNFNY